MFEERDGRGEVGSVWRREEVNMEGMWGCEGRKEVKECEGKWEESSESG